MIVVQQDGFLQLFIKITKFNFLLLTTLMITSGCYNSNPNTVCCIARREISTIPNNYDLNTNETLIGSSGIKPTISVNEKGDGLIIWDNAAKKIKTFIVQTEKFVLGDKIKNSTISVDNKGNGLVTWISSIDSSDTQNKNSKLYGKLLKEYVPVGEPFLITNSNVYKFKVYLNNNRNGLVVWQNEDAKIYGHDITNFSLPVDLKNEKNYSESNIEELYFSDQNSGVNIKNFSFNYPEGYLFFESPKIDSSGNGYVSWVNKEKNLILKIINNYMISDKEIILAENIASQYKIDLYSGGYGLIAWFQDKDIFIKTINSYQPSYMIEKLNINNKETISSINVQLNENGDGILTWLDSLKNLYAKKINI